jgi:hypothetical protein
MRIIRVAPVLVCMLAMVGSEPASAAFGFCNQPMAPTPFLRKPTKPYCAIDRSCEQWQVDSYKNEIDRYFKSLKSYLADVDRYREDAYAYAKCMADFD